MMPQTVLAFQGAAAFAVTILGGFAGTAKKLFPRDNARTKA